MSQLLPMLSSAIVAPLPQSAVRYTFALLCALRLPEQCATKDGLVRFERTEMHRNPMTTACYTIYRDTDNGRLYRVTVEPVEA